MKRMMTLLALVLLLGAVSAFAANGTNIPAASPVPAVNSTGWVCPGGGPGWHHGGGYGMTGPRAGWHGQGHRGWGSGPHGPGFGHFGWHGQGGMGPGAMWN